MPPERTKWATSSKVEIIFGTMQANSGPHPQRVYADEVELMAPDGWESAREYLEWGRIIDALSEDTKTTRRLAVAIGVETDEYGQFFGADGSVLLCVCGAATITNRTRSSHVCPCDRD